MSDWFSKQLKLSKQKTQKESAKMLLRLSEPELESYVAGKHTLFLEVVSTSDLAAFKSVVYTHPDNKYRFFLYTFLLSSYYN